MTVPEAEGHRMTDDIDKIYESFWRDIVEKGGRLDVEAIKRELYDYHTLLNEVPKVYSDITGGRISKPNTLASEVIAQADAYFADDLRMNYLHGYLHGWCDHRAGRQYGEGRSITRPDDEATA
jgi:hypothetical protein